MQVSHVLSKCDYEDGRIVCLSKITFAYDDIAKMRTKLGLTTFRSNEATVRRYIEACLKRGLSDARTI
jgi:hypothetical protein